MRIGLLAASDDNPYAAALAAGVRAQGHQLACIVYGGQSRLSRLVEHLKVAGPAATLQRIAREFRPAAGSPDNPEAVLAAHAAECKIEDWRGPLSRVAARDSIPILKAGSLNDPEVVEFVKRHTPDLLLNAAGTIYRRPILEAPRLGVLNAHMGRLPAMRGMNVLEWSLLAGEPLGVTIHFVEPGIDTGPILVFREFPLRPGDRISALRCRSYALSIEAMMEALDGLRAGTASPRPQSPGEGRQHFVMHPRLLAIAERRLAARIPAG